MMPDEMMPDEMARGQSISDALRAAAARLRAAGVETPERDARLLLAAAAGITSARLLAEGGAQLMTLGPRVPAVFWSMLSRRSSREPVARILGERAFYGRVFKVSPATLDPRADTETVVSAALEILGETEGWERRPWRILDVGTGTGCLLVTLLAELPEATGVGTDISAAALEIAKKNASLHHVAERAELVLARSLEGLAGGTFDLVIANPPYIPTSEIASLAREVRDFDPRLALDGGPDGLDVYREIARGLSRVVPEGWAVFEVGAGQADSVAQILRSTAWQNAEIEVRFWKDLGGHTRCVAAKTHSGVTAS